MALFKTDKAKAKWAEGHEKRDAAKAKTEEKRDAAKAQVDAIDLGETENEINTEIVEGTSLSDRRTAKSKAMKEVTFVKSRYLGGLPDTKPYNGNLMVNDQCIGVGILKPQRGDTKWEDMAGISFESGSMKKSRAGAALAVGVFALAARNTQDRADLTVSLKDGNVALYQIPGQSGAMVRGKIQPFLAAHGVPCLGTRRSPLPLPH